MDIVDASTSGLTEENTSRYIQTKKWRLHYNEAGEGHPLILLHGSGPGATGWSNFNRNIHQLSQKYRVILLDFPGWGKSDAVDAKKEPRHMINAESVKLLMDELGLDKAAVVGNSLGGMAALLCAGIYPDRISHCVTMGMGPLAGTLSYFTPGGRWSEGLDILFQTYLDPSPENFKRLVKIMVFDQSFATDELAKMRSDAALEQRDHLDNFNNALPLDPTLPPCPEWDNLPNLLRQTKVPMMLMHGRDDRVISHEVSMMAATLIPTAQLVVFNRCGHWVQVEHTDYFNSLLDGFVSVPVPA